MARIFDTSGKAFFAVEHLILEYVIVCRSPGDDVVPVDRTEVDRTEWRKILRSVNNVKTLQIDYVLVNELSRFLRFDGEEDPLELLPELQELRVKYSWGSNWNAGDTDAFASFIDARQNAGLPVTLFHLHQR
jgi:hypothetical protein